MKFPAYVPEGVRSRYATIRSLPISPADQDRADRLAGLSRGHSMENAYKLLKKAIRLRAEKLQRAPTEEEFDREFQYYADRFFDAAWAAGFDFSRYRDTRKRAKDLKKKIGKAALCLAELLREFQATGLPGPSSFYHVDALLKQTENPDDLFKQAAWAAFRDGLFKDHYAWSKAPDLDQILEKLAQISREFEPQEPSGVVAAAIGSQKRNRKVEYVRAFGDLLKTEHKIDLTPDIMNAMADTATVAINNSRVVVTYNDVKNACKKLV